MSDEEKKVTIEKKVNRVTVAAIIATALMMIW